MTQYLPADGVAMVRRVERPYYTQPMGISEVRIVAEQARRQLGAGVICRGEVELSSRSPATCAGMPSPVMSGTKRRSTCLFTG